MVYTNSPLAKVEVLSPHHSGERTHRIDTITIHCVVGQCSAKALGELFADPARGASSNYGIGYDGEIGLYVEEKNRSWCSSSESNDQRAVTIEVASGVVEPYTVTTAAYNALIELVTDICKRNDILRLVWSSDKNERVNHLCGCNMTVHRDYDATKCPGTYLYERMPDIAREVNERREIEMFVGLWDDARRLWQSAVGSVWSEAARKWAVDRGLIQGSGDTVDGKPLYMWQDFLTREQLVTILHRFYTLIKEERL